MFLKPILSKLHLYLGKQPVHILKAEDQQKIFVWPQYYIFWLFKSVFWQFLCEKKGRKSRDLARRLVFLVSRRSRWRPKDSRPSVRASVRACVTLLLENCSLLLSETLQLVMACRCEKNVPSAFLKKIPVSPILPKNCPKWGHFGPKCPKMEVFRIFLGNRLLLFW